MTELPMSLETIPIWEAPHSFARDGQRVFSYGLLLPQLRLVNDDEGRAQLAARWGELEVGQLHLDMVRPLSGLPLELRKAAEDLGARDVAEQSRLLGGI